MLNIIDYLLLKQNKKDCSSHSDKRTMSYVVSAHKSIN